MSDEVKMNPVVEMTKALQDKFDALSHRLTRAGVSQRRLTAPEVTTALHQNARRARIAAWAMLPACREDFLPWLQEQIDNARGVIRESIVVSHPLGARASGYEEALSDLYALFAKKWVSSGQVEGNDPARSV